MPTLEPTVAVSTGVEREKIEAETLPSLFWDRVGRHGEKVVWREKRLGVWQETTWAEAGELVEACAHGLMALDVESTGTPLGLFPENAWQVTERRLEPGDVLFLYTDGLVEAHREDGEQFEDERLMKALNDRRSDTPRELIEGVFQDAETFCEGLFDDDVTMLAVRRLFKKPFCLARIRIPTVPVQFS